MRWDGESLGMGQNLKSRLTGRMASISTFDKYQNIRTTKTEKKTNLAKAMFMSEHCYVSKSACPLNSALKLLALQTWGWD